MNSTILKDPPINYSKKSDLTEDSANLYLRRTDWRYLLANPNPKKSICFSKGKLFDAVEYISESTAHPGNSSVENEYDLAVAINPDKQTLERIRSAIRPGGCCYIEWELSPFIGTKHLRKKLKAIGFNQISLYLPKLPPATFQTNIWIPLEDDGPIAFFLNESLKSSSTNSINMIGKNVRKMVFDLSPELYKSFPWLLSPGLSNLTICSLAAKPSKPPYAETQRTSGSDKVFINTMKSKLLELGVINDVNEISILMYTKDFSVSNKAVHLVFTKSENTPSFIVKMPRTADAATGIANEANILFKLKKGQNDNNKIPNLLFYDKDSGSSCIGETFVDGNLISTIITHTNYINLAHRASELIVELTADSKISTEGNQWDKLIKPVLTDFSTNYEPVLNLELIKKTNDILKDFNITQLVYEHGDFAPCNVLIDSNGVLSVIDWEDSKLKGLPALDLIFFLSNLFAYLDDSWEPDRFLTCYRNMLNESTSIGKVYKECMTYYCNEFGISYSSIYPYRIIVSLIQLNWSYNYQTDFGKIPLTPESLSEIKYIKILEEELMRYDNNHSSDTV